MERDIIIIVVVVLVFFTILVVLFTSGSSIKQTTGIPLPFPGENKAGLYLKEEDEDKSK